MTAPLALSVVMPVYNEERNIATTLAALHQVLPDASEVLCVYDLDSDTTLPVLRELQATYPRLQLVRNAIARGPSGALRSGLAAARGRCVLVAMADLCDDLEQIPELLRLVPEHADIACPSRYCRDGRQELDAYAKAWLPRLAGILLHWLAGIPTYDPTNSYKMYSAELLQALELESTVSFSVTLEIVAKAHCAGYRIVEIPTVWRSRLHGESTFRIGPALPAYLRWFLLALRRNRLCHLPCERATRPRT